MAFDPDAARTMRSKRSMSRSTRSPNGLDADIAKCFDRIDRTALLAKLKTSPRLRRVIKGWLEAGVMDGEELFPTTAGTPQGGVISPLLSNILLTPFDQEMRSRGYSLTRYADDCAPRRRGKEATMAA